MHVLFAFRYETEPRQQPGVCTSISVARRNAVNVRIITDMSGRSLSEVNAGIVYLHMRSEQLQT